MKAAVLLIITLYLVPTDTTINGCQSGLTWDDGIKRCTTCAEFCKLPNHPNPLCLVKCYGRFRTQFKFRSERSASWFTATNETTDSDPPSGRGNEDLMMSSAVDSWQRPLVALLVGMGLVMFLLIIGAATLYIWKRKPEKHLSLNSAETGDLIVHYVSKSEKLEPIVETEES